MNHCITHFKLVTLTGMSIDGLSFFNPYTIDMEDAVEVEVMGKCNGHPAPTGEYHHHGINK